MFEGAVTGWRLWQIERARKRIYAKYDALAQTAPTEEDKDAIRFEERMEIDAIDDNVRQLQNNRLIRLAHKYLLEIPIFDDKHESWEESGITGKYRLTQEAFVKLRNAVRAERKARREQWQSHFVWISAATGMIGALTGLISVIFFHVSK